MSGRQANGAGRIVVFRLEGERFGVEAAGVEEVLAEVEVTPLPGLPSHVLGVLRHRERWLPLLDAAPALGLPGPARRRSALIVRRGRARFALAADAVLAIRDGVADPHAELFQDDEGVVTLLAPDAIFDGPVPEGWEEDEMTQTHAAASPASIVAFRVADAEFGLTVGEVHEVLEYARPTAVPRAPDFVEGVLDLRGVLLPVIDLRARLGVPVRPPDADTRILVAELHGERIGLVVDAVSEVLRIAPDRIAPPPEYVRGLAAEYLEGIARAGDRMLILLRVDRILTAEERLALLGAEAASDAGPARKRKPRRAKKGDVAS